MRSNGIATTDPRSNLLRAFKASGCCKCGKRYPELDWSELHSDHIDPRQKAIPSPALQRMPAAVVIAELLKCQVLCTECHKAKTRDPNGLAAGQLALFAGNGSWHYGAAR